MRKTKKALAMLMAAALFAGPCAAGRSMYEVHAEEMGSEEILSAQEVAEKVQEPQEAQEETDGQEQIKPEVEERQETRREEQKTQREEQEQIKETQEAMITVEGVSVKGGMPVNALETPVRFDAEVQVRAPEGMGIRTVELGYYCMEKNKELRFLKTYDVENMWYPGTEGGICEVAVELTGYIAVGMYVLEYISVDGENNSIIYNYDSENKVFIEGNMEDETSHRFGYAGEADYTVAKSAEEDNSRPEVTSLKRVTTGDIYSNTSVQYEIGYKEEGSGIKKIEAIFFKEEDTSDRGASDEYIYDGKLSNTGTGNVGICSEYREPGRYRLEGIGIEDYAGNRRYYSIDEAGTAYIDILNDNEEKKSIEVSEADRVYEVKLKPYDGVMLKGIKAVLPDGMDKDRLAAGDAFEVIATVVNNSTSEKQVCPEGCMISWGKSENDSFDYASGSGQPYMLAPKSGRRDTF